MTELCFNDDEKAIKVILIGEGRRNGINVSISRHSRCRAGMNDSRLAVDCRRDATSASHANAEANAQWNRNACKCVHVTMHTRARTRARTLADTLRCTRTLTNTHTVMNTL